MTSNYIMLPLLLFGLYFCIYLFLLKPEFYYVGSPSGLHRHRFPRYRICDPLFQRFFSPLRSAEYRFRRRFWYEAELPLMLAADRPNAGELTVLDRLAKDGAFVAWKDGFLTVRLTRRPSTEDLAQLHSLTNLTLDGACFRKIPAAVIGSLPSLEFLGFNDPEFRLNQGRALALSHPELLIDDLEART